MPRLLTLTEQSTSLEAGETTAVALAEEAFKSIEDHPDQAVFTSLTKARAMRAAKAADERRKAGRIGPLDGVPMAWKDLFDQAREVTTAASETRRHAPPAARDAAAVSLLEGKGAISLGRTNLTEFAFSGLGLNPTFGTPSNAWGEAPRAPGGSSSGSAVAVAEGLASYAMGTDTSGSVRIPAALNGLVGFKPTAARISRIGVGTLSPTLDSIGPITHTVADALLVCSAFGLHPTNADLPPLIVPAGCFTDNLAPEITAAFEDALVRLREDGVFVERRRIHAIDKIPTLLARHGTLVGIEANMSLRDVLDGPASAKMDPRVRNRLVEAKRTSADLAALLVARTSLATELVAELRGALLVLPTTAIEAPLLSELEDDEAYLDINSRMLRNTMLGSFLDLPSLAIPAGLTTSGLPASLMLSGPAGCDGEVLNAGHLISVQLTGDVALNAARTQPKGE